MMNLSGWRQPIERNRPALLWSGLFKLFQIAANLARRQTGQTVLEVEAGQTLLGVEAGQTVLGVESS